MLNFNVAIEDLSYIFRLRQSNQLGVAEICSTITQLLHYSCALMGYILPL